MLPIILGIAGLAAVVFSSCDDCDDSEEEEESSPRPATRENNHCHLNRSEFREVVQTSPSRRSATEDRPSPPLPECSLAESELRRRIQPERLDDQPEFSLLEEIAYEHTMIDYGYPYVSFITDFRPRDGARGPSYQIPRNLLAFYRGDLTMFRRDLEASYSRAVTGEKRTQNVYIQFDLESILEGYELSEGWTDSLRSDIVRKIESYYEDPEGTALPHLVFDEVPPENGEPYTLVLVTDRTLRELMEEEEDRPARYVAYQVAERTPPERSEILAQWRAELGLEGLDDGGLLRRRTEIERERILRSAANMGSVGRTYRRNPLLDEFGNTQLDDECFILTRNSLDYLPALLRLPPEEARDWLGDLIADTAAHELGHALGLYHTEIPGNLMSVEIEQMSGGPGSLPIRRPTRRTFNPSQWAYLRQILGP